MATANPIRMNTIAIAPNFVARVFVSFSGDWLYEITSVIRNATNNAKLIMV